LFNSPWIKETRGKEKLKSFPKISPVAEFRVLKRSSSESERIGIKIALKLTPMATHNTRTDKLIFSKLILL